MEKSGGANLKKGLIVTILSFVIISTTFILWHVMADEDDLVRALAIEKLINVNIYGTQKEGYTDIEIDGEYLLQYESEQGVDLGADMIDVKVTPANNLKNGDVIVLNIVNSDELEKRGIHFDKTSVTYSISGLKEGTDYNVFSDIQIYLDDGKIVIDSSNSTNFVRDNVEFFVKDENREYKPGEKVVIGAYTDMNAATDNGYKIVENEREFIVEQEKTND